MQSAGSPPPVVSPSTGEINFPTIHGEPISSATPPSMWFDGLLWNTRKVSLCSAKRNLKAWNFFVPPTLIPVLSIRLWDPMDVCMSPICTEESFRMLPGTMRETGNSPEKQG